MDVRQLHRAWHASGKNRPAWVRNHAVVIEEYCTTSDPIPSSLPEVDRWLDSYASVVSRQLNEAVKDNLSAQADESGESDMVADTQGVDQ